MRSPAQSLILIFFLGFHLLEIFKNYNPENLITYYLDNLSKSTYAIEIPENINKSTIFNQFKKDSMNESKHEEIPIKKIKSISEFIVKAIEYDENWMNLDALLLVWNFPLMLLVTVYFYYIWINFTFFRHH